MQAAPAGYKLTGAAESALFSLTQCDILGLKSCVPRGIHSRQPEKLPLIAFNPSWTTPPHRTY